MKQLFSLFIIAILSSVLIPLSTEGNTAVRAPEAVTPDLVWGEDVEMDDWIGDTEDGITYFDYLVSFRIRPAKFLASNGDNLSFVMDHFNFTLLVGDPVETYFFKWTNWGSIHDYWYHDYDPTSVGEMDWTLKIININDTENPITFDGTLTILNEFKVDDDTRTYYDVFEDEGFNIDLNGMVSREVEDYHIWFGYSDGALIVTELGHLLWNVTLKENISGFQRSIYIVMNDTYARQIELSINVYIKGVNDKPIIDGIIVKGGDEIFPETREYTWVEDGKNISEIRKAATINIPENWPHPVEIQVDWTEVETFKENMKFEVIPESDGSLEIYQVEEFIGTFRIGIPDGANQTIWAQLIISDNGVLTENINYGEERVNLSDEIWIRIEIIDVNEPPVILDVEIDKTEVFTNEDCTISIVGQDPEDDNLTAIWWLNDINIGHTDLTLSFHSTKEKWSLEQIKNGVESQEINVRFKITDGEYWTEEQNVLITVTLREEDKYTEPPTILEVKCSLETVKEGDSIQLIATGMDPDGDSLNYSWSLKDDPTRTWEGSTVTIDDLEPGGHVFKLTVSDGKRTVTDYLFVSVEKKEEGSSSNTGIIVMIIAIIVVVLIAIIVGGVLFMSKKKKGTKEEPSSSGEETTETQTGSDDIETEPQDENAVDSNSPDPQESQSTQQVTPQQPASSPQAAPPPSIAPQGQVPPQQPPEPVSAPQAPPTPQGQVPPQQPPVPVSAPQAPPAPQGQVPPQQPPVPVSAPQAPPAPQGQVPFQQPPQPVSAPQAAPPPPTAPQGQVPTPQKHQP